MGEALGGLNGLVPGEPNGGDEVIDHEMGLGSVRVLGLLRSCCRGQEKGSEEVGRGGRGAEEEGELLEKRSHKRSLGLGF